MIRAVLIAGLLALAACGVDGPPVPPAQVQVP
jgi:predicted small lipoprotein YifL